MTKPQTHPEDRKTQGQKAPEPESCLTPRAVDDRLDEELEQSFPASDPPSFLRDPPELCAREDEPPENPKKE